MHVSGVFAPGFLMLLLPMAGSTYYRHIEMVRTHHPANSRFNAFPAGGDIVHFKRFLCHHVPDATGQIIFNGPQKNPIVSFGSPDSIALSALGTTGHSLSPAGFTPVHAVPSPARWSRVAFSKNRSSATSRAFLPASLARRPFSKMVLSSFSDSCGSQINT